MVDTTSRSFDSKVSVFKLNDGSTLQDISDSIKEVKGLPGQVKMNDVTAFGSVGERPAPSIQINHFAVEGMYNRITTTGAWPIISAMWAAKASRAFEYWPGGTGEVAKSSGTAYLAVLEQVSRVGDWVTFHAEFHCDNGVTVVS